MYPDNKNPNLYNQQPANQLNEFWANNINSLDWWEKKIPRPWESNIKTQWNPYWIKPTPWATDKDLYWWGNIPKPIVQPTAPQPPAPAPKPAPPNFSKTYNWAPVYMEWTYNWPSNSNPPQKTFTPNVWTWNTSWISYQDMTPSQKAEYDKSNPTTPAPSTPYDEYLKAKQDYANQLTDLNKQKTDNAIWQYWVNKQAVTDNAQTVRWNIDFMKAQEASNYTNYDNVMKNLTSIQNEFQNWNSDPNAIANKLWIPVDQVNKLISWDVGSLLEANPNSYQFKQLQAQKDQTINDYNIDKQRAWEDLNTSLERLKQQANNQMEDFNKSLIETQNATAMQWALTGTNQSSWFYAWLKNIQADHDKLVNRLNEQVWNQTADIVKQSNRISEDYLNNLQKLNVSFNSKMNEFKMSALWNMLTIQQKYNLNEKDMKNQLNQLAQDLATQKTQIISDWLTMWKQYEQDAKDNFDLVTRIQDKKQQVQNDTYKSYFDNNWMALLWTNYKDLEKQFKDWKITEEQYHNLHNAMSSYITQTLSQSWVLSHKDMTDIETALSKWFTPNEILQTAYNYKDANWKPRFKATEDKYSSIWASWSVNTKTWEIIQPAVTKLWANQVQYDANWNIIASNIQTKPEKLYKDNAWNWVSTDWTIKIKWWISNKPIMWHPWDTIYMQWPNWELIKKETLDKDMVVSEWSIVIDKYWNQKFENTKDNSWQAIKNWTVKNFMNDTNDQIPMVYLNWNRLTLDKYTEQINNNPSYQSTGQSTWTWQTSLQKLSSVDIKSILTWKSPNWKTMYWVYMTDPNWANSVNSLYNDVNNVWLDNFLTKYKWTPITSEMINNTASKYWVDPNLIASVMANDSSMWTAWRAVWTKNPWNVWNTWSSSHTYDSWESWVDAVWKNLAWRIKGYNDFVWKKEPTETKSTQSTETKPTSTTTETNKSQWFSLWWLVGWLKDLWNWKWNKPKEEIKTQEQPKMWQDINSYTKQQKDKLENVRQQDNLWKFKKWNERNVQLKPYWLTWDDFSKYVKNWQSARSYDKLNPLQKVDIDYIAKQMYWRTAWLKPDQQDKLADVMLSWKNKEEIVNDLLWADIWLKKKFLWDWQSWELSKNLIKYWTAIDHLWQLYTMVDWLEDTSDVKALNKVKNWFQSQFWYTPPVERNLLRWALVKEMASVLKWNASPTDQDTSEIDSKITDNMNQDQYKSVLKIAGRIMTARLNNLWNSYKNTMWGYPTSNQIIEDSLTNLKPIIWDQKEYQDVYNKFHSSQSTEQTNWLTKPWANASDNEKIDYINNYIKKNSKK